MMYNIPSCVSFLQALLISHDTIAQKDYYPRLPDIPVEVDEDEETVKIVQLVKSDEPLVCFSKSVSCVCLVKIHLLDNQQI